MANEDFYNQGATFELRYPELAYNMVPINRGNPGVVPFYIPALYPYSAGGKVQVKNTVQRDSNIKNQDKNVPVGNVSMSNCINIKVPKEVCGFVNGGFTFNGSLGISSQGTCDLLSTHVYNLDIQTSGGSSHSHSGTVSVGGGVTETRACKMNAGEGNSKGHFNLVADDSTIPKGASWVVVFIGGDISRPMIIARCYE